MKYRKDFVTNSSSSSYVCDVCGAEYSGWDLSLNEAEMIACENGHIFCIEHIVNANKKDILQMIKDGIIEDYNNNVQDGEFDTPDGCFLFECFFDQEDDLRSRAPAKFCPICQFEVANPKDAKEYFMKKLGLTEKNILDEWRKSFKDYSEFKKYCEGR